MLFVSPSSAIPAIYGRRDVSKAKTYITGSFGEPENLFNVQDYKQHAGMRRLLTGPVSGLLPFSMIDSWMTNSSKYKFTNVKKMEPLFDGLVQEWINRISTNFASKEEKTLDFATWSKFVRSSHLLLWLKLTSRRYLAYDVIGEIGFGTPFGFIETASDVSGMIKNFEDGVPLFGLLGRLYPFTVAIKKTWIGKKFLIAKPEDKSGWGPFMRLRDTLIDRRKKDIKDGNLGGRIDLLQTFVALYSPKFK